MYIVMALWLAFGVFLLFRNERVYAVRCDFIDKEDLRYFALPTYRSMLLNPRFWLLWTTAHWRAWIDRQHPREHVMACRSDLCSQGRKACPTPHACQLPEPELRDLPRWAPYLGGVIALIGAFAAYLYLAFGHAAGF